MKKHSKSPWLSSCGHVFSGISQKIWLTISGKTLRTGVKATHLNARLLPAFSGGSSTT